MLSGIEVAFFPLLAILVPFAGMLLILALPRGAARWICAVAAGVSLLACLAAAGLFAQGGMQGSTLPCLWFGSVVVFGFTVDAMSTLLAAAFVGIGFLVTVYSFAYLNKGNREHPDEHKKRFYAVFIAFIGAMAGLVFSSTILGQLVFFEITGACSWSLIGYYNNATSRKSAMKALIITHIASLGLYCGAAVLFLETGSFELQAIAQLGEGAKAFVLIAILVAAWGKSAQLPFYMWLPSAMEAPTPVSPWCIDGEGWRVHFRSGALVCGVRTDRGRLGCRCGSNRDHGVQFPYVLAAEGHQTSAGVFDDRAAFVYVSWFRLCDLRVAAGHAGRYCPYFQPCVCQDPVLPRRRRPELHDGHAASYEVPGSFVKDAAFGDRVRVWRFGDWRTSSVRPVFQQVHDIGRWV